LHALLCRFETERVLYNGDHSFDSTFTEKQSQPFLFPISLCEQSAKENTPILYCNGVTPIQLKELVPDLLIGEMFSAKIPYSALKIGNLLGSGGDS